MTINLNELSQWLFPDSAEGERKFLVRTDFGSGGGGGSSKNRHGRRRSSTRNRNHNQGSAEDTPPPSSSFRGDRKRLFLLVELTCTVQTAKDGDGLAGGGTRGRGGGGGEGAVRGPLKNFRVSGGGSGRGSRKGRKRGRRVGGIKGKGGDVDDDDSDSCSYSGEGSSADGYDSQVSIRPGYRLCSRLGGERHWCAYLSHCFVSVNEVNSLVFDPEAEAEDFEEGGNSCLAMSWNRDGAGFIRHTNHDGNAST